MSSVTKKKQVSRKRKQGEFEVDKIIDKRIVDEGVQYKIKWKGFPTSENSWEPVTNLISCQEIILEFEKKWKQSKKQKKIAHNIHHSPQSTDKKESKLSIQKQPEEVVNTPSKTQPSLKNNPTESNLKVSRVSKIMNQIQVLKSSRVAKSPSQPPAPTNYAKNKMAVSQVVAIQPKKTDLVVEPASVKRSLASHIRNQHQQEQQEISKNTKGRKLRKAFEKMPDQTPAQKDSSHQNAQRFIEKYQARIKQKNEIRDKALFQKDFPDKVDKVVPLKQILQPVAVNKQRETQMNKNLKLEDDPSKQKKPMQKNIEKSKLYQSSVNQITNQNTQSVATNQVSFSTTQQHQRDSYVFKHMQRYKCLDHYLNLHNRMSIKNIINKDKGGAPQRAKLKLVNVGDYKNAEGQLNLMKKVTREISIEKLEIFVKLNDGWIAVGKNKNEGLFITDVNLLHESVWKVIEDMYKE